jgi:hypothetical protein
MRGFHLNRWQRIGIMLSVVWAIFGGIGGWQHTHHQIDEKFKVCLDTIETASDLQDCRQTRFRALAVQRGYGAALVGLAPIPVAWLLAYASVALARRIKGRGSKPQGADNQAGNMRKEAVLDVMADETRKADHSFNADKFAAELRSAKNAAWVAAFFAAVATVAAIIALLK